MEPYKVNQGAARYRREGPGVIPEMSNYWLGNGKKENSWLLSRRAHWATHWHSLVFFTTDTLFESSEIAEMHKYLF